MHATAPTLIIALFILLPIFAFCAYVTFFPGRWLSFAETRSWPGVMFPPRKTKVHYLISVAFGIWGMLLTGVGLAFVVQSLL